MRIFLAGATGAIGRPLITQLLAANHEVVAMTRSERRAAQLRERGASAVVCDVFDRINLHRCVREARPDAVIHQLTALPTRMDPRKVKAQLAETNRLRVEGTQNLFDAALTADAKRFIAQSIAFVYDPNKNGLKVEDQPLYERPPALFAEVVQAIRRLEEITLSSSELSGVALRYGYFYGPRTFFSTDGSFAQDVRKGHTPIVGKGTGVFSFIHVEDAAAATVAALQGEPGVYNIVDDEPAQLVDWLPYYARLLGARSPRRVPRWVARLLVGAYGDYLMCRQRGASNAKAKRWLGWSPRFPTWRSGFDEMLRDYRSAENDGVAA